MPKLAKAKSKSVGEQESQSFEPLDPGWYVVKLEEVASGEQFQGPAGPYWRVTCGIESHADGSPCRKSKTFDNLSMSEAAEFKVKQFFDAFGVSYDTDTDDLIGKECLQRLIITTIQSGSRAGEATNSVAEWKLREDDGEDDGGF